MFKSKTVDSIVKFLSDALNDLAKVEAEHRANAEEHVSKAEDHRASAADLHDEANRASAIASNLRKILGE